MDDATQISQLRELLHRANRAYYAKASPIMSDHEYDVRLAELADLEKHHPELDDPNSPTRRVGGEITGGFASARHALPMLSIDNTYSEEEVRAWGDRISKTLGRPAPPTLIADPKIDGVALSLRYENGALVRAVTRGDGAAGDDVTANVRAIGAVPLILDDSTIEPPAVLEIRGEAYFPLDEFERVNKEREKAGDDPFMNPRNACAGTLKQLNPTIVAQRRIGFFAHGRGEVIPEDFARTHTELLEKLVALGAPVNPGWKSCETIDDVLEAIHDFDNLRHESACATDGVVVRVDDFQLQKNLGATAKSPRWCVAFKFPAEQKETTLLKVDFMVGKSGRITPRAVMEPVLLGGTEVQRASLFNFGEIRRKDLRIGDTVVVEKAGEIIPQVLKVVKEKRPKDAAKIKAPTHCPACNGPVDVEYDTSRLHEIRRFPNLPHYILRDEEMLNREIPEHRKKQIRARLERDRRAILAGPPAQIGPNDETGRYCINPECPAQIREKLIWFAGRGRMDIDGLGEKTVDQIRNDSDIPLERFADIFKLKEHKEKLLTLDRMGDKKVYNLLRSIELAKSRGLARTLGAMGIRHVGDATARALARMFSDIDALLKAPEPQLCPKTLKEKEAISFGLPKKPKDRPSTNLGKETAPAVHAYLHSKQAQGTFRTLHEAGVNLTSDNVRRPQDGANSSVFEGKTIVLTGKLDTFTRPELTKLLESLGAQVVGTVSTMTDFIIGGVNPGPQKMTRANQLSIPIWDEATLLRYIPKETQWKDSLF